MNQLGNGLEGFLRTQTICSFRSKRRSQKPPFKDSLANRPFEKGILQIFYKKKESILAISLILDCFFRLVLSLMNHLLMIRLRKVFERGDHTQIREALLRENSKRPASRLFYYQHMFNMFVS